MLAPTAEDLKSCPAAVETLICLRPRLDSSHVSVLEVHSFGAVSSESHRDRTPYEVVVHGVFGGVHFDTEEVQRKRLPASE